MVSDPLRGFTCGSCEPGAGWQQGQVRSSSVRKGRARGLLLDTPRLCFGFPSLGIAPQWDALPSLHVEHLTVSRDIM